VVAGIRAGLGADGLMRRRTFIRSAGLVIGGAPLGAVVGKPAAPSDRVGIGVIGTGVRGQQLIGYLGELSDFEIVACCDELDFRLAEGGELAGPQAKRYADYRALLDDREVEAVIVATPFYHHARAALDALDAGRHVYCEKTMTKGTADTQRVLRAARATGLSFQTGLQFHYAPVYAAAVEMIRGGELGQVAAVNCQWNRNGDWRRPVPDPDLERKINWRMYREYSGGLAAELCAHQMNFCNQIIEGNVDTISGVGGVDFWRDGRETYDNIQLTCRYDSGVTASFESLTSNSLGRYRITVLGNKGSLELTFGKGWYYPEVAGEAVPEGLDLVSGASVDGAQGAYRLADTRSSYAVDAPEIEPTLPALAAFARAIRDGRQPEMGVEAGAKVAMMVQMGLDAMDQERVLHRSDGYRLDG
jgi:predicted dehydrogenase